MRDAWILLFMGVAVWIAGGLLTLRDIQNLEIPFVGLVFERIGIFLIIAAVFVLVADLFQEYMELHH